MELVSSRRSGGVTLIELMATIAIVAILSAVALPSFASLQRNTRRTVAINDFIHAVFLARSEAIKRNSVVSICRSDDGLKCNNDAPNWNGGWIVFENLDRDQPADADPGEPILMRHEALVGGALTSNRESFSFRPYAQSDVNGTLVYCPTRGSKDGRAIIISHTGRPRASNRDASGKALKC